MMARKLIISFILFIAASAIMQAQTIQTRLDSLFDALSASHRAMGSISISQGGRVIYSRATGYSAIDATAKVPATTDTKYRIASITKMFTAAMIFQLIQEGEIETSTTLDEYFPKLPGAKNITIGMMLSHRSGIHNILDDPDWGSWKDKAKTQSEMLAMIGKYPLDFTPGSKASYSNSNYILLGYIIEQICDKPYKEAVNERIISKIGLKNTYCGAKTDISKGECYSYAYSNDWTKQVEADMSILGGAGSILSTPADLNTFIVALYSNKIVKSSSLEQMLDITDGYGMGIIPFPLGQRTGYGHNGGIDGFSSLLEYFPDDDLAISYCSNGITGTAGDVVNAALTIVFDSTKTDE
jgi:D-alanyl-D-alanine carboxypeptidase